VGVSAPTVHRWLAADPELRQRVHDVQLLGELGAAEELQAAIGRGEPWAIRFFLERRAPEFRPVATAPVEQDREELAREQAQRIAEALGEIREDAEPLGENEYE